MIFKNNEYFKVKDSKDDLEKVTPSETKPSITFGGSFNKRP